MMNDRPVAGSLTLESWMPWCCVRGAGALHDPRLHEVRPRVTRGPYNAGAESREETVKHGRAIIVGGGIFGVTAALELRRRGQDVVLLDPGPLPHPLAASTDISKVVRLDYGPDEDYTACMERAIEAWRGWNAQWPTPLFHETGVVFL